MHMGFKSSIVVFGSRSMFAINIFDKNSDECFSVCFSSDSKRTFESTVLCRHILCSCVRVLLDCSFETHLVRSNPIYQRTHCSIDKSLTKCTSCVCECQSYCANVGMQTDAAIEIQKNLNISTITRLTTYAPVIRFDAMPIANTQTPKTT